MLNKDFLDSQVVRQKKEELERKKFSLASKFLFDKFVSMILLCILSPIFLILAVLIKLEDGGSVFYRQERVTTNGRIFKIFKFRTMIENADKKGSLVTLQNDSRITRIGSFIRNYRLDEIPQLINVLIGDMSFVGTRPEVVKYVEQYAEEMKTTLLLPAGVTSLASIEFKDEDKLIKQYMTEGMEVDEIYVTKILPKKMIPNIAYINSFSIFEDIKIMIRTVIAVLK
ncbi:sugar transferase [Streptococcus sp. zg-86]|uniref:Sugar transferase n=1 Tax=Streptococcus zhangguiae TaxID=2664091 RepID=A0A6I4RAD5_9STRE|nr:MULTISPECIES: sugar transferase [unclassified Streptococcus]MTB64721.1 sugar transferase [Streptococcus sp. zg-86]MTB91531.1 sugar transferase [Streptococcus sp. zg-36]MWV56776.1 sugar transferase [Streptococcus sp. zg-70]QTH48508.1 sugar transferase [Streptococcus sp. zg-86]